MAQFMELTSPTFNHTLWATSGHNLASVHAQFDYF